MQQKEENKVKKANCGRKSKFENELSFAYCGVRVPLSWKGTSKMEELRKEVNELVKNMCIPPQRKKF